MYAAIPESAAKEAPSDRIKPVIGALRCLIPVTAKLLCK